MEFWGNGMKPIINDINSRLRSIHVISGSSGTGKTSLVEFIAKHNKLDLLTFDAGVKRSLKYIKDTIQTFINYGSNKGIFMDEFEIFFIENIGAQTLLQDLSTYINIPIFIAINSKFLYKLKKIYPLKSNITSHSILSPSRTIIINKFCKLNPNYNKKYIQYIVDRAYPDIRSMKNHLQMKNSDIENNVFEIECQEIFKLIVDKTDSSLETKMLQAKKDMFTLIPIMHENYLKLSKIDNQKIIADLISTSDVYHTKMYETQDWNTSYLAILCGLLLPSHYVKLKTNTHVSYGSILSKISNLKTKEKTFNQMKDDLNVDTDMQLKCIHLLGNEEKKTTAKLKALYL